MIEVRETMSGKFAVDSGEGFLLTDCPCCGNGFNLAAAQTIADKLASGELDMGDLRTWQALNEALREKT